MHLLQQAGVAAGVVQNAEDLYLRDPQLKERGFFAELTHPEIGPGIVENVPIKLSAASGAFERPGPLLGQHNEYVLRELLGLSEEEIDELVVEGVPDGVHHGDLVVHDAGKAALMGNGKPGHCRI
jgi:crotonobetainyl-CoA:carnitine CoA-transferase CaiB-like acyl-CoA transferase